MSGMSKQVAQQAGVVMALEESKPLRVCLEDGGKIVEYASGADLPLKLYGSVPAPGQAPVINVWCSPRQGADGKQAWGAFLSAGGQYLSVHGDSEQEVQDAMVAVLFRGGASKVIDEPSEPDWRADLERVLEAHPNVDTKKMARYILDDRPAGGPQFLIPQPIPPVEPSSWEELTKPTTDEEWAAVDAEEVADQATFEPRHFEWCGKHCQWDSAGVVQRGGKVWGRITPSPNPRFVYISSDSGDGVTAVEYSITTPVE